MDVLIKKRNLMESIGVNFSNSLDEGNWRNYFLVRSIKNILLYEGHDLALHQIDTLMKYKIVPDHLPFPICDKVLLLNYTYQWVFSRYLAGEDCPGMEIANRCWNTFTYKGGVEYCTDIANLGKWVVDLGLPFRASVVLLNYNLIRLGYYPVIFTNIPEIGSYFNQKDDRGMQESIVIAESDALQVKMYLSELSDWMPVLI